MTSIEVYQELEAERAHYAEKEAALYQSKLKCEELYRAWKRQWKLEWEAERNRSRNTGRRCPEVQVSDCQV